MTGCAGFIGSHLIEALLKLNQKVVGLDNFATGHQRNLKLVRQAVGGKAWKRFHFIQGDIRMLTDCYKAFGLKMPKGSSRQWAVNGGLEADACRPRHIAFSVDIVLHQAALGSVPRSIKNPLSTHETNVTGFVNMLIAARDAKVERFVYASSSSVYGDSKELPKREARIGNQLSPYAVSKYANELYAKVFGKCYGMKTVGLRYFNVFGPRQDPNGPYAAVIPRWIVAMKMGEPVQINGDGKTSRDFCYVDNAVQANLLAGITNKHTNLNEVCNVACGKATSLALLHAGICTALKKYKRSVQLSPAKHSPFREGDIRHSLASISKGRKLFGYLPSDSIDEGIKKTVQSFCDASTKISL